ncbi:MAG TPA: signal peptidase I [Longimicrobiaceae bacterium]|nr:signal peptidase I [Longimicrobiaceae bacterium]
MSSLPASSRTVSTSPAKSTRPGRPASPAKKSAGGEAWEWVKSLGVALVLFLVLRTFLVQAFSIPSGSMKQTLLVGDYLMASNVVFGPHLPFSDTRLPGLRDPRHGDVVVFRPTYNQPVIDVVKRVIGEPGDTLHSVDGTVFRNGERLVEPYVIAPSAGDQPIGYTGTQGGVFLPQEIDPAKYGYHNHLPALTAAVDRESYTPTNNTWGPLVVPEGQYFLMGDNRDESLDSRFMGFVPRDVIRGKPLFIYFSYDPELDRPFPKFLTAARWGRIGTVIR